MPRVYAVSHVAHVDHDVGSGWRPGHGHLAAGDHVSGAVRAEVEQPDEDVELRTVRAHLCVEGHGADEIEAAQQLLSGELQDIGMLHSRALVGALRQERERILDGRGHEVVRVVHPRDLVRRPALGDQYPGGGRRCIESEVELSLDDARGWPYVARPEGRVT